MKLRTKLMLLYVIATIFIIVAVGWFFHAHIWEYRLNSIHADMMNELKHVDFALNAFILDVESDVRTLVANEDVRTRDDRNFTNFLHADERNFQYQIGDSEQKIIDIFNNYLRTHSYVNSVYMGRENGGFVRSHKRQRPTRYDPRQRPWYKLAKDNPTLVMKTDAYPSLTTSDVNIGIVKALVDEKGAIFGVVGVDVTLEKLTNYIANIQINPEGKIVLMDRDGLILAGLGKEMLFKSVDHYAPGLRKALKETQQGYISVNIQHKRNYVFALKAMQQGWTIVALIPFENIEKEIIDQIIMTITGLSLGLILLSFLTLIGLDRYVVAPLQRFIKETNYIARTSNLERRIDIYSRDEIGMLAASYNQMLATLSTTYQSLKETESKLIKHLDHLEELVRERTASLEEANESLSAEIQERLQTLNELAVAKERAEAADKLKSAFLAAMSHELRTPLNSIIGFTGIILQGIAGPLNEEQKKQLQMVRSSAHLLLSLINDVLDLSKIEAKQLQIAHENYDLRDTIEKAAESMRPLAEKKGLEITCSIAAETEDMVGDSRRVEQVLLNLLSNAVKFTDTGSIKIECIPERDKVIIRVTDTGIGIKAEDMDKIFQAFQQIDSGITRKYEGTGLGLSICKRLVELMGGEIQVSSSWGVGSTFSFSLPKERKDT